MLEGVNGTGQKYVETTMTSLFCYVRRRMPTLAEVLQHHRVVVCVGSGGVGKTTISAALAVEGAAQGKNTLCLTIDPARRLANSLGLSEIQTSEQDISASEFAKQGIPMKGSLSAMMLDTKRTFDELVKTYASSPERREKILSNKLYRYLSSSLAGTQEYMAMEKLHAVRQDPKWDLIVLDTPPTSNALDFLDAPERLVATIDSAAMRWFIQAFEGTGRMSFGMISKSAGLLMKALARFTGTEFLEEVGVLVSGLNDLFGGFRERAGEIAEALRSDEVAFVIVTSTSPLAMREALFFNNRLRDAGMTGHAFVINGVHPILAPRHLDESRDGAELAAVLPRGWDAEKTLARMHQAFDDERVRGQADRLQTKRMRHQIDSDKTACAEVPAFEEDVHDLASLWQVAGYLMGRFDSHWRETS